MIAIYFGLASVFPLATPVLGIVGALIAGLVTFTIGRGGTLTMILAGAAVMGLAGAGLSLALNFAPSPYAAYEITTWLLGSLSERSWSQLLLVTPFILAGMACLLLNMRALDALTLGETQAASLGIDLERARLLALIGTALAVGAATSVTGGIAFVGLLAPHLVRPFVGHQPSRVLLPAALFGAILLLTADIATRLIPTAQEVKLGVLTSLAGTPFFFWLVLRLRRSLAMTRLSAEAITIKRNGRAIVDGVSATLAGGMFVALLGPNGAGKSTLLHCLSGLLRPDGGRVALDGADLKTFDFRALARRRAFLPQSPRAEWPVSVERLVALGLTPQLPAFGGLPADMAARVTEILAQFDLLGQRDQPATTLSGGELARAMLARALVGDPDMLLADEPLTGLDPRHAIDSIARLRGLADAGRLVVASIHDLTLAARFATHIAMMCDGQLIAFGETQRTLTSPLLARAFEVDACVSGAGIADGHRRLRGAIEGASAGSDSKGHKRVAPRSFAVEEIPIHQTPLDSGRYPRL